MPRRHPAPHLRVALRGRGAGETVPPARGRDRARERTLDDARWIDVTRRLGCPGCARRFLELRDAYAERHRHYHTARHVVDCLSELDATRHVASRPDEVEFALWLHDIVYRTRRTDNEEASAAVARRWLEADGASAGVTDRIVSLILVTRHADPPGTADEALVLDIDLHVLGAAPERYDEYAAQIRREYRWVPRPLFDRRRAALLEAFLARDAIYHTEWYRSRLEAAARANLEREVRRLRAR